MTSFNSKSSTLQVLSRSIIVFDIIRCVSNMSTRETLTLTTVEENDRIAFPDLNVKISRANFGMQFARL